MARLLPLPPALLLVLIFVAMLLPLAWPYAIRYRFLIAPLVIAGLAGIFLVVFPKVQQMHSIGRGTDQPDCVIRCFERINGGQLALPERQAVVAHPMSCGPGWVALQAPVVKTAGYPVNLAAIWLVSLLAVRWALGWSSTASLLTLLGLSPGLWLAAANGTDFLSFGIAVAALIAVASRLEKRRWVFILLAGLVAQFRMPTLLVPAFFTRQTGRLAALTATGFALCCQVGFLYWNASSFIADGPLHILFKLTNAHLISSNRLLAALEITLPILAAATRGKLPGNRFQAALFFAGLPVVSLLSASPPGPGPQGSSLWHAFEDACFLGRRHVGQRLPASSSLSPSSPAGRSSEWYWPKKH